MSERMIEHLVNICVLRAVAWLTVYRAPKICAWLDDPRGPPSASSSVQILYACNMIWCCDIQACQTL